jgi:ribosomal protein S18 acetylase RimI-like enzyme
MQNRESMPDIVIRSATADDEESIVEFNRLLAEETERKRLDVDVLRRGVRAALGDGERGRYYVAVQSGEVIGQLLVTHEWSDWRDGDLWWIQSVYVAKAHRRQGVFSMLYSHVERLARHDPQVCGMRLYVDEGNEAAKATYTKLGLEATAYRVMEILFS